MSLFTRNLNRCGKNIVIQSRAEKIINGRATEVFTEIAAVKAIIKTPNGVSTFDSTNTERVVTHELCIAYIPDITAEAWVLFGTRRVKILSVVNCGECDETLRLFCTERGEDSKVVNRA